jgi:hypothetical protein
LPPPVFKKTMKKLNNTFLIDRKDGENADSIMEKLFSGKEDDNMFSNVYKIIEWNMSEWFIKNGVKQKKEDIYLYVESLPDYFKQYTVENDKFLRICVKHKIKETKETKETKAAAKAAKKSVKEDDNSVSSSRSSRNCGYKKIKSKFIIKNFKSGYRSIINGLELIKVINYMEITEIPNTDLININISTDINLCIPMKDDFENYLATTFDSINENLKKKLSA